MVRGLTLLLLIAAAYTFTIQTNSCEKQLVAGFESLKSALSQTDADSMIDKLADTSMLIPGILSACGSQQLANTYQQEVPQQCVAELDKAAKLGVKILGETQNDLKVARDIALFEKLYQAKVKKDCPFLHDVSVEDLKSGGVCLESAYKLSLVLQQLEEDARKGDKAASMKDIDAFITGLPDTLDACGESAWAAKVRKFLPMNCVHAVESLIQQLGVLEHNYIHLQWIVKHYKEIEASFMNVKANCPIFK